jgi:hypothetical protein
MGTRGVMGFRFNGIDKLVYNHYDSYPAGLGNDLLKWLQHVQGDLPTVEAAVQGLTSIAGRAPTAEDIERLQPWTDLTVGEQRTQDWYCLLRLAQGDPGQVLKAGFFDPANDFILDSLFCEWGYIVNLDERTFEVYRGFQKQAHAKGRYAAHAPQRGYYPCALVAAIPFAELPAELDEKQLVPEEYASDD